MAEKIKQCWIKGHMGGTYCSQFLTNTICLSGQIHLLWFSGHCIYIHFCTMFVFTRQEMYDFTRLDKKYKFGIKCILDLLSRDGFLWQINWVTFYHIVQMDYFSFFTIGIPTCNQHLNGWPKNSQCIRYSDLKKRD